MSVKLTGSRLPFKKAYSLSKPAPPEAANDVLEARAYAMMSELFVEIVSDPTFQKAFSENTSTVEKPVPADASIDL